MPSLKKIKLRKHSPTGKRHAKLSGGGNGPSTPKKTRSLSSKKRSSSVGSPSSIGSPSSVGSSNFVIVESPEENSNNSSPVNPEIQKLKDESTEIDARINELLNGNYSIQSAEDELKRVAAYKTQIEGMLKAYNKGEWTPDKDELNPDKETDKLNRQYIENTIRQTNEYYENNKYLLEKRINEYKKRIAELTARKDEITKQIQELKHK